MTLPPSTPPILGTGSAHSPSAKTTNTFLFMLLLLLNGFRPRPAARNVLLVRRAVVTVIFAPESGALVRKRIESKVDEGAEYLNQRSSELRDSAPGILDAAKASRHARYRECRQSGRRW
jgi:hypothetical protein